MPDPSPVPAEAVTAVAAKLAAMRPTGTFDDCLDEVARALTEAAAPAIREAERQQVLDDGDQTWAEATRAERDRIWSRPVTQHLELHGTPHGPVWRCAGCLAELTESTITHMPRCTEMGGGS